MTECEFEDLCDQIFGCGRDCSREPKSIETNVERCSLRALCILVHNNAIEQALERVCIEDYKEVLDLKMEEKP